MPATYKKLTTALESVNYKIHIPPLPSMNGSRPPNANLETDTSFVREYVQNLIGEGHTVVVIMHSYGGQVGSNALHGLGVKDDSKGGVAHLIYMAAFALPEGSSMVDKVKEFGHEELLPMAFDFADDGTVVCRDPKLLLIGDTGYVDEKEVEDYLASLKRWNGKCMYENIAHSAWREIPVTYICTSGDMTVPLDYQKSMIEAMRKEGREVKAVALATGHSPTLTMTKEVVDVIEEVVANY